MRKKHTLIDIGKISLLVAIIGLVTGCTTTQTNSLPAQVDDPMDWLEEAMAPKDDSWKRACSEYSHIGF